MSTIDKINAELTELQRELSDLHNYTEQIATAKDSSLAVIKMSQEFIISFQKRVAEINNEMANAAGRFERQCQDAAVEFESANKTFKDGIGQARATLAEIGNQLTIAAQNVNDLTKKIESINILGHFERIHTSLTNFNDLVKNYHNELINLIKQTEQSNQQRHKQTSTKQTLLIAGVVVNILLVLAMLLKVMKR